MQFENFENAWEVKKWKCESHFKWEPIICKIMRGFQVWPQNSNRITFDPLFGQKLSKIGTFHKSLFSTLFFAKNGVKCYPIWILRPDLHLSHHFTYHKPPFEMILNTFSFFDLPCIFKIFKSHMQSNFFRNVNFDFDIHNQCPKMHKKMVCNQTFSTKVCKGFTPICRPRAIFF